MFGALADGDNASHNFSVGKARFAPVIPIFNVQIYMGVDSNMIVYIYIYIYSTVRKYANVNMQSMFINCSYSYRISSF